MGAFNFTIRNGLLKSGHFNTIYSSQFAYAPFVKYHRQRFNFSDGDFCHLDCLPHQKGPIALLLHGLEGSSQASYIRRFAHYFHSAKYHVVAMNQRGCSGEGNLLPRSYHSGNTGDLNEVVSYLAEQYPSRAIHIIGFSLGGNITLHYAGLNICHNAVKNVVGISVPCDLQSSAARLSQPENRLYLWRFLYRLKAKMRVKMRQFPDAFDWSSILNARSFWEFDEHYTAPAHGYKGANDYYTSAACLDKLEDIKIPSLLINAKNDPFLSQKCFPVVDNAQFKLEYPNFGGHVGFLDSLKDDQRQLLSFVAAFIAKT